MLFSIQAVAGLVDVKNLRVKIQYGSCWINVTGQIQAIERRVNLTGNFNHKWSWLLRSYIPETIQVCVVILVVLHLPYLSVYNVGFCF